MIAEALVGALGGKVAPETFGWVKDRVLKWLGRKNDREVLETLRVEVQDLRADARLRRDAAVIDVAARNLIPEVEPLTRSLTRHPAMTQS